VNSVERGVVLPFDDYAALQDLHDEAAHKSPHENSKHRKLPTTISPPPQHTSVQLTIDTVASSSKASQSQKSSIGYTSRFACARTSPLICPNAGLVAELAVIRRSRDLEGEDRSALSYSRAIAVRVAIMKVMLP
jgi:hypothetical protein